MDYYSGFNSWWLIGWLDYQSTNSDYIWFVHLKSYYQIQIKSKKKYKNSTFVFEILSYLFRNRHIFTYIEGS